MRRVLILLLLELISLTSCNNNNEDVEDVKSESSIIGESDTTLSDDEFAEELIEFFNEMEETTSEETD